MLPEASTLGDLEKPFYVFSVPSSGNRKDELNMGRGPCSTVGEVGFWEFAADVAVELGQEVSIQGIRGWQAVLE